MVLEEGLENQIEEVVKEVVGLRNLLMYVLIWNGKFE
jgi:hypothetical protein